MTAGVVSLKTEDTVDMAYELLEKEKFHHLPVVDEDGLLEGIISKMDLVNLAHGRTLFTVSDRTGLNKTYFRTLRIRDIMTCDVEILAPDDTIEDAMRLFSKNLFHAIPIVKKGKLMGIVSTYDLLEKAYGSVKT